ncbi:Hypp3984 [Branchiostoma lanceolatum]|uniref:Hypp3984 protein n=1 Tax=Branchiostoma lanceolatum TaxID=7740 RepID=A0A8K0A4M5_BRALA|nr:Hypp3984 [Branchiostoma lanceolatum]
MLRILKAYGTPEQIVTTPDGNTRLFEIQTGVLQGDTLAPYLFVIVLDYTIRVAIEGMEEELGFQLVRRIGPRTVTYLDFADDITLISEEVQQAQKLLGNVETSVARVGLQMNAGKNQVHGLQSADASMFEDHTRKEKVEDFSVSVGTFFPCLRLCPSSDQPYLPAAVSPTRRSLLRNSSSVLLGNDYGEACVTSRVSLVTTQESRNELEDKKRVGETELAVPRYQIPARRKQGYRDMTCPPMADVKRSSIIEDRVQKLIREDPVFRHKPLAGSPVSACGQKTFALTMAEFDFAKWTESSKLTPATVKAELTEKDALLYVTAEMLQILDLSVGQYALLCWARKRLQTADGTPKAKVTLEDLKTDKELGNLLAQVHVEGVDDLLGATPTQNVCTQHRGKTRREGPLDPRVCTFVYAAGE